MPFLEKDGFTSESKAPAQDGAKPAPGHHGGRARKSLWQKFVSLSLLRALGNIFYSLGFFAETKIVQAWRVLRDAGIFAGQLMAWLFGGLAGGAWRGIKKAAGDIAAPFKRFFSGVRNMRRMVREGHAKGERRMKGQVTGYLASGIKNHGHLVSQMLLIFVPAVALAALAVTLYSVLNMRYALAVSVGDTAIGYVENETVLEDGLNLLRMKISLAEDQDLNEWDFTPTLTVAPANVTLSKTQVADKILKSSPEDLQEGYGLYVDGVLRGATIDGEGLQKFLEEKKAPYLNNPVLPDATVDFVRKIDVSVQKEVFLTASMKTEEELENELNQNVTEAQVYASQPEDTLGTIAAQHGITMEELLARNPELEGKTDKYKPAEGTQILIHRAKPFLQVKTVVRSSAVEEVPFETERVDVDTRRLGQQATVQKGENGEERVWYDNIYIDGELTEKQRLDAMTETIKPTQNKIIEVGTAEGGFASIGGSGDGYIWPVPESKYSSTPFGRNGHRGIDINAPTGTPIYAAAGGLIIASGWHSSYGNYIEIQHNDGMVTLYGHCSELLVGAGVSVNQGDAIALVGSTGFSTGPHCHFEMQQGGHLVNPAQYVVAPWE